MGTKAAEWRCWCGESYRGKWPLYHHIKNSHSRRVLEDLEEDLKLNQYECGYCDNNPIKESSLRDHARKFHLRKGINDFIKFKCTHQ
jgi:hypothetical protein